MKAPSVSLAAVMSMAGVIATIVAMAAIPSTAQASGTCPGPALCGETCSLDPYGTPIYCTASQCQCAAGYDTMSGPNGVSCQPHQPDFMGSSSESAGCPGACTTNVWGFPGSIANPFDLIPVHGTSPGGEAFMPVWGQQANNCGAHGVPGTDAAGNPIRTWNGCAADAHSFCLGIQSSDEGDFSPSSCDASEGCGDSGLCVSDFTSAWPYLDDSVICKLASSAGQIAGQTDPSRMDFTNNVIVYRAPITWENHGDEDDDYTWNLHSPGHELYDTDSQYEYQGDYGRVHVEHDSDETIDHFTDSDWGPANKWWRDLRNTVDNSNGSDDQKDFNVRCYVKSFVNTNLTCPLAAGVDPNTLSLRDPTAVVVGVPSLDCADNDHYGTDEIHPAYAVAIRIQDDPTLPEKWTFFYHRTGNNGPCGTHHYARCATTFQLPLALPAIPDGKVLTSADVHVDAHSWAGDGSSPSDATVQGNFDLANGTVLTITLPETDAGVVGLVTVTPAFDTIAPTITCPNNITTPPDLGKCTAAVSFSPTVSDNCSVKTVACSSPSGTAFPLGTTTDTCTATDYAGLSSACSFAVTTTAGNKCPLAAGYWKNHASLWPVTSLMLGTVPYSQPQLINILQNPTNSDASVILAKQLIAALLSLANGSSPVSVCNTIADANSALGSCRVPCNVPTSSTTGQVMINDANTLELFNNDKLTPGCTP